MAALCLGLAAAGCTTTGSTASLQARDSTIAFESIDGPPPAVFRKLVQKLGDEAQARQVPMVTREGFAPYRIRGYLAAGIEKKKKRTLISWVWDVYDGEQQRAFRVVGEEVIASAAGDAWAAVDDAVLGRIAQKGMAQLVDYLRGPGSAPVNPAGDIPSKGSEDRPETLASNDDFHPESFGIFRLFTAAQVPAEAAQASAADAAAIAPNVPLPRERPKATAAMHDKIALAQ